MNIFFSKMASGKLFFALFFVALASRVESASFLERSYEYVLNLGKNLAPSFMSLVDCMGEEDVWSCAKLKAGKLLDGWDEDLEKQRRSWQNAADAEISQSGRTIEEMPSKLGREVETSLNSIAELVQHGVARAYGRKHHGGGGIDSITVSTAGGGKKKKKPSAGLHVVQMPMIMERKPMEKGRSLDRPVQSWVIGHDNLRHYDENSKSEKFDSNVEDAERVDSKSEKFDSNVEDAERVDSTSEKFDSNVDEVESVDSSSQVANVSRKGRGILEDAWSIGEKALDSIAEHAVNSDNVDNGVENDKSSLDEQRGKKKKKKKAILKLLLLGAVLKAKIGTLLQILSFKLQVKFFIIALIGLAINLARFWIDLKNKHHQQPQKVIYYEHAQHQHHYDEHEESPGWGPWSRSIDPEQQETDVEIDLDLHNSPYRAQERNTFIRPAPTRQ